MNQSSNIINSSYYFTTNYFITILADDCKMGISIIGTNSRQFVTIINYYLLDMYEVLVCYSYIGNEEACIYALTGYRQSSLVT